MNWSQIFAKCFYIIWKPWGKKKELLFTLWKQLLTATWESREVQKLLKRRERYQVVSFTYRCWMIASNGAPHSAIWPPRVPEPPLGLILQHLYPCPELASMQNEPLPSSRTHCIFYDSCGPFHTAIIYLGVCISHQNVHSFVFRVPNTQLVPNRYLTGDTKPM